MSFSCFVIGEGPLAKACADLLLKRGHRLLGVVSPDPDLYNLARKNGLPFYSGSADLETTLAAYSFDYLFSIIWRQILPSPVLSMPHRFAVNYHDAPLPRYAGTHATPWALINMESRHAVTWHAMTGRVDAGKILRQKINDLIELVRKRATVQHVRGLARQLNPSQRSRTGMVTLQFGPEMETYARRLRFGKIRRGKVGDGSRELPERIQVKLRDEWQRRITPVPGYRDYNDMHNECSLLTNRQQ